MTIKFENGSLALIDDYVVLVSGFMGKMQVRSCANNPIKGALKFERFQSEKGNMVLEHQETGLMFTVCWKEVARWLMGDTTLIIKSRADNVTQVYGTFVVGREGLQEYVGAVQPMPIDVLNVLKTSEPWPTDSPLK